MAVVVVYVLLFLGLWGEFSGRRLRPVLWRPLLRAAGGGAGCAALLAVGLQVVSGAAYLVVGLAGVRLADGVGVRWLGLAVTASAGLLYFPVVVMAVPHKSRYYAEMRAVLVGMGATPAQASAAARAGGTVALFVGIPLALTLPAAIGLIG
ncbi:hypothetical protein [Actinocorallia herbida]|nr:hypothetical protein [Actinocorallia herbida]